MCVIIFKSDWYGKFLTPMTKRDTTKYLYVNYRFFWSTVIFWSGSSSNNLEQKKSAPSSNLSSTQIILATHGLAEYDYDNFNITFVNPLYQPDRLDNVPEQNKIRRSPDLEAPESVK